MVENYLSKQSGELAKQNLLGYAAELNVSEIAKEILLNEDFCFWTGSSKKDAHHYGDYGLVIHTHEVVFNGIAILNANRQIYNFQTEDLQEFFLSALFHDYGKIFDYEELFTISGYGDYCLKIKSWGSTDHKRKIHHISRSAIFFSECAKRHHLSNELTDRILHNILSHHGCREYGSPVAPNSRIAWVLHLSDMISARLYDCDTLDRLKNK